LTTAILEEFFIRNHAAQRCIERYVEAEDIDCLGRCSRENDRHAGIPGAGDHDRSADYVLGTGDADPSEHEKRDGQHCHHTANLFPH
jgi:hypothetical protein